MKNIFQKQLVVALLALGLYCGVGGQSACGAEAERTLRLVTGDPSGPAFSLTDQLVQALSDLPDEKQSVRPKFSASAQTMTAAPAALRALRAGVADVAVVPDAVVQRVLLDQVVTQAARDLRAIAALDPHPLLIIVRSEQQPLDIGDLEGKTLMIGMPGSDERELMVWMLAMMGLYPGQYRAVPSDHLDAMLDRLLRWRVDAVVLLDSQLALAVRIALQEGRLHVLEPSKVEIAEAVRRAPFLVSTPAPVEGVGNIHTLSTRSVLMVSGSLPDDLVTQMLTRLATGPQALTDFEHAGDFLPAPLHKAAESFYRARESSSPDSSSAPESSAHVTREP